MEAPLAGYFCMKARDLELLLASHGFADFQSSEWDQWPQKRREIALGQAMLRAHGYEIGAFDGIDGRKTRAGLAKWKADSGFVSEPVAAPSTDMPSMNITRGVHTVWLHTSATPGDWQSGKTVEQMRDEIKKWHTRDRGWSDIGYHFVIAPDGSIAVGRDVNKTGAHVKGHNTGSIGLCMIPVKTITTMATGPEAFYTPECIAATKALIAKIAEKQPIKQVRGHNSAANKLCPGWRVDSAKWL